MQPLEPTPQPLSSNTPTFADPTPERSFPTTAVAIASVAVVILIGVLVMMGRQHAAVPPPNTILPAASYASNLAFTNLQMSQSSSMSGGKFTYIEGHVANHGPRTVTGITVQVVFGDDVAMRPQIETVPVNVIYMREPYVDTRPVGASPLAPGAEADFRLIFDDVNDNWNQQLPQIHAVQVATR
jgi:hypothetical protein